MGSIGNWPLTSKMVPHAYRAVSRTLHAYGLRWESCIQLCDYMWWCVHGCVNTWCSLCTCDDDVELWICELTWW